MAFCSKCGAEVAQGAGFCAKCGAPQPSAASATPDANVTATAPPAGSAATGTAGMPENVAGLLSYAFGWVTGLIFFFVDKRPFVRFHAAQSIVVFGGLHIILLLLGHFVGFGFFGGFGFGGGWGLYVLVYELINLTAFVLWILLMVKAYQHEKFRVPAAADFADQLASK